MKDEATCEGKRKLPENDSVNLAHFYESDII